MSHLKCILSITDILKTWMENEDLTEMVTRFYSKTASVFQCNLTTSPVLGFDIATHFATHFATASPDTLPHLSRASDIRTRSELTTGFSGIERTKQLFCMMFQVKQQQQV